MGGLLKVKVWMVNEVSRSSCYIIECLNVSEVGTQWDILSS